MNKTPVTLPTLVADLGKEILASIQKGDEAKAHADKMYKLAGQKLIEAKARVKNFQAFLTDHCNGLSRSRAYELIGIAEGSTTVKKVRERTNKRVKRHRAAKQSSRQVSATQRTNLSGTVVEAKPPPVPATQPEKVAQAEAEPSPVSATQRTNPSAEAEPTQRSPVSDQALAEFKVAIKTWVPKMDAATKQRALDYLRDFITPVPMAPQMEQPYGPH